MSKSRKRLKGVLPVRLTEEERADVETLAEAFGCPLNAAVVMAVHLALLSSGKKKRLKAS